MGFVGDLFSTGDGRAVLAYTAAFSGILTWTLVDDSVDKLVPIHIIPGENHKDDIDHWPIRHMIWIPIAFAWMWHAVQVYYSRNNGSYEPVDGANAADRYVHHTRSALRGLGLTLSTVVTLNLIGEHYLWTSLSIGFINVVMNMAEHASDVHRAEDTGKRGVRITNSGLFVFGACYSTMYILFLFLHIVKDNPCFFVAESYGLIILWFLYNGFRVIYNVWIAKSPNAPGAKEVKTWNDLHGVIDFLYLVGTAIFQLVVLRISEPRCLE